jgi:hypothetical protein
VLSTRCPVVDRERAGLHVCSPSPSLPCLGTLLCLLRDKSILLQWLPMRFELLAPGAPRRHHMVAASIIRTVVRQAPSAYLHTAGVVGAVSGVNYCLPSLTSGGHWCSVVQLVLGLLLSTVKRTRCGRGWLYAYASSPLGWGHDL